MFSILSVAALHEPMPVIMFIELYSKKKKSIEKKGTQTQGKSKGRLCMACV